MTIPYQTISLEKKKKKITIKKMDVSALYNPGLYKITYYNQSNKILRILPELGL